MPASFASRAATNQTSLCPLFCHGEERRIRPQDNRVRSAGVLGRSSSDPVRGRYQGSSVICHSSSRGTSVRTGSFPDRSIKKDRMLNAVREIGTVVALTCALAATTTTPSEARWSGGSARYGHARSSVAPGYGWSHHYVDVGPSYLSGANAYAPSHPSDPTDQVVRQYVAEPAPAKVRR